MAKSGPAISFRHIQAFFKKIRMLRNPLARRVLSPTLVRVAPTSTETMYYLTFANTNKFLKFENI